MSYLNNRRGLVFFYGNEMAGSKRPPVRDSKGLYNIKQKNYSFDRFNHWNY